MVDESGSGNDLVTAGVGTEPTYEAAGGFEAGGFLFANQRLTVPIDINPGTLPELTMGAWVRSDALPIGLGTQQLHKVIGHDNGAWDRVLGLDSRTAAAGGPQPQHSLRYTAFTGTNNFGPVQNDFAPTSTSDWTFLAVTYDQPNNTATVYVDLDVSTNADALQMASSATLMGTGNAEVAIGSIRPDLPNEGWAGSIDNVFFYDEILTAAQLTAIRDGGKTAIVGSSGDPSIRLSGATNPLFGDLTSLGAGPGPIVRTVSIQNVGELNQLNISRIEITGPDAGLFTLEDLLPSAVPPAMEQDLDITLTPPLEGGSFSATLEVDSNDAETPTKTLSLDATITSDPNLVIVAADPLFGTMVFNSQPGTIMRIITVRNTGAVNHLALSPLPAVSGANAASYSLSSPLSVAPGEERDIVVSLNPGGSPGAFSGSLEISTDDPDTPSVTISLDANIIIVDPAEIIAFYPFDDTAAPLTDATGVTGDATIGGGTPTYNEADGFEGGYYQFGGTDRLIVPLDINPGVLPQITLGAWVRNDEPASGLRKVMGHDNGAWDRTIGLDNRGGPFRYTAFTGTNNNEPVAGTPEPANTEDWTFLAATYDDILNVVSVFVDLDASTTDDPLVKVSEPSLMGDGWNTLAIGGIRPDLPNEGWVGCIDNAFIYSGILTDAEVENLRNLGRAAIIGEDNFRITEVIRNPDGTVTLTWNSDPGAGTNYAVLYNSDLNTPLDSWGDDNDSVATGGETTTYTTEISFAENERMFFVVRRN